MILLCQISYWSGVQLRARWAGASPLNVVQSKCTTCDSSIIWNSFNLGVISEWKEICRIVMHSVMIIKTWQDIITYIFFTKKVGMWWTIWTTTSQDDGSLSSIIQSCEPMSVVSVANTHSLRFKRYVALEARYEATAAQHVMQNVHHLK